MPRHTTQRRILGRSALYTLCCECALYAPESVGHPALPQILTKPCFCREKRGFPKIF
jgi:hypothetical protein